MAHARPPLDGGRVLITGASSGIGRELALQIAPRAATLLLVARRQDLLADAAAAAARLAPRAAVETFTADLGNEAAVERLADEILARYGGLDILVNNAGVGDYVLFDRAERDRTFQVIWVNALAPMRLAQRFLPGMVERGRGGILNIGSGLGHVAIPAHAAYTAAKYFVAGFSAALRADLAGTGVAVTEVAPGPVATDFQSGAGRPKKIPGLPARSLFGLTAEHCAREALAGFARGQAVVYPGFLYRQLMRLLPLVPPALLRRRAARIALRLRAPGGST